MTHRIMKQVKNNSLIAAFVDKKDIIKFLTMLSDDYSIAPVKVFVYEVSSNPKEYLTTFRAYDKSRALSSIKHSTTVHVKNGCIFSINALNQLIDSKKENDNVANTDVEINWEEYRNKLMIIRGGHLKIDDLKKVELKDLLFNK